MNMFPISAMHPLLEGIDEDLAALEHKDPTQCEWGQISPQILSKYRMSLQSCWEVLRTMLILKWQTLPEVVEFAQEQALWADLVQNCVILAQPYRPTQTASATDDTPETIEIIQKKRKKHTKWNNPFVSA